MMKALIGIAIDCLLLGFWLLLTALPVYYWWNFALVNALNLPPMNIVETFALVFIIDILFKGKSFRDYIGKSKKE
jgi:hypothetical protein